MERDEAKAEILSEDKQDIKANHLDEEKNICNGEAIEMEPCCGGQETCCKGQESCCTDDGEQDEANILQEQILEISRQRDEYLEMARRARAEFDNFKRRNNNAISEAYQSAEADTIAAFLPVLDNLERAVDSAEENKAHDSFIEGIEMIIKQFKDIMGKLGVEEIEAMGKPFDPTFHNAVMQAEIQEGQEDNMVVEVFQKGYKTKDKVIRYSMVKVAK